MSVGVGSSVAVSISQRGAIVGGDAIIAPSLFRELDAICKRLAGRPLRIYARSESPLFGRCQFVASTVCSDAESLSSGSPKWSEDGLIEVAAEIRIAKWNAAARPEIDLAHVPSDRIHEFVVLHEIGHKLDNYSHYEAQRLRPDEWPAISELNEVLADRFAWALMFPGVPLPVRSGCEGVAAWVDAMEAKLSDIRRANGQPVAEAAAARMEHAVPLRHLQRCIPFSRKLGPLADGLEQARSDYRKMQYRRSRARLRAAG